MLKLVIEIRFIHQIIVWIKHYNIFSLVLDILRVTYLISDLNNHDWPAN